MTTESLAVIYRRVNCYSVVVRGFLLTVIFGGGLSHVGTLCCGLLALTVLSAIFWL